VQPHRFDILEGVGCAPVTYPTLPAYFLFYMWPQLLLGTISLVFSSMFIVSLISVFDSKFSPAMILCSFYRLRRPQFVQPDLYTSALSPNRYFRLILFATIDILCNIPIGVYIIYASFHGIQLNPWISWEDTHFNFGRVVLYPALLWRQNQNAVTAIEFNRWSPIACALGFFAIFGFSEEATNNYRRAFNGFVGKLMGFFMPEKKKLCIPP
jgi:pheromone a factor receptor